MSNSIAILGRQPALGLAELESLYGADALQPLPPAAARLLKAPETVDFDRLGGSIKLATELTSFQASGKDPWVIIEKRLRSTVNDLLPGIADGKIRLGLSAYGFNVTPTKLSALALNLKKPIKAANRSVRVVPNNETELNSAQVLHNQLTGPTGVELLVIQAGTEIIIARTINVQDIDAYAARDQGRPKRDARVGMLPPKLAQTIANLAVGTSEPSADTTVLDPFCGTGVVLQEASLMGYGVYGSDLEQRMVDYTDKNLAWLQESYRSLEKAPLSPPKTEVGDATTHRWNPIPHIVAAETYLGQPFTTIPTPEKLEQVRSICNTIHRKFLQNISGQLQSGDRLCLAVPAWQTKPGIFQHLSTLDHLEELGYNRISFKHVETADLIYARADQIVARELLVLVKK